MRKVTVITSNPESNSLTNAVGKAFADGATSSGARADIIDLYKIGFNPVYGIDDRNHYLGKAPVPEDIKGLQEQLADSDVIALVFPIYWYSMPAMMKGFLDRVFCRGFAYYPGGKPGRLAGKTVRIVLLTGSSQEWTEEAGIDEALRNQIIRQALGKYCGIEDVEFMYVDNLKMGNDDPERRARAAEQLEQVREMSADLI